MRGKAQLTIRDQPSDGITPAYAGKSPTPATWRLYAQDHPRLCGEKNPLTSLTNWIRGSPPPMRGKDAVR